MWRFLGGGLSALLLVAAGFFFFRGGAKSDAGLLAAPGQSASISATAPLPDTAPAATDRTREQKRFDRYDKDRNGQISRDEYLISRRKAYAKLDTDHDGKLSFDEWAIKTTTKFASADADRSGAMNPAEFLTTKVVHKTLAKPVCPPANDDDG